MSKLEKVRILKENRAKNNSGAATPSLESSSQTQVGLLPFQHCCSCVNTNTNLVPPARKRRKVEEGDGGGSDRTYTVKSNSQSRSTSPTSRNVTINTEQGTFIESQVRKINNFFPFPILVNSIDASCRPNRMMTKPWRKSQRKMSASLIWKRMSIMSWRKKTLKWF